MRKLCSLVYTVALVLSLVWIVSLTSATAGDKATDASAQAPKQKGMSYASWWHGQYSHPDADLALQNLAATGANWISLIVTQYQDTISSTVIYADSQKTPPDGDLIHAITQAHSLGLQVMLKPHIDLANDPGHWRGQIGQDFTEPEWDAWFTSYQAVIDHYAQLAQAHGVEQLCVGTELSASQDQTARWRSTIAGVDSHYTGALTYAANWDNTDLTWWDTVDTIGVDAYYPLTDKCDPTVDELKAAWTPYVAELSSLAETWEKPILFTEIGYRSQDCANRHPWEWATEGTVDLEEQADCYTATFESVYDQSWFAGMHWWVWETDPFQGGPCDDGFTPYDKPAEDVLRFWYGTPPRSSEPVPLPDYAHTLDIYTDDLAPGWQDWSYNAAVDLSSASPAYSGTQAISVTAQAWGALSLYHEGFSSTPYYWIEFYVRKSSAEQKLRVFLNTEHDQELRYRPVDDCRYTDGKAIESEIWTQVLVPLSHLDAMDKLLQRVSIKNYQEQPSIFWVDQVRLVGTPRHVYVPLVIRNER